MNDGDFIIDDFSKPLRDILDAMEAERSETNVKGVSDADY
jgi:hypothetical protein